MKKKALQRRVAAKRGQRAMVILAVCVIVVATAVTVISRQNSAAKAAANVAPIVPASTNASATTAGRYVTRRVGNQDIQIDAQTGQVKPLTPQEAQRLAEGLAAMVDNSTDGLVQARHADGSVSMDLQGRFQNVAVAKVNTDGAVVQGCVDNPRAAAAFFGINPKLIEDAQTAQRRLRPSQAPN